MTTFNTRTGNGSNMLVTDYDLKKIFVWDNRYENANLTNSTYDAINYPAGLVLGRVSASGEVVPLLSTAVDGSQYPVGILSANLLIDGGDSREVPFAIGGDVAEELVVTSGTDTLDTVIPGTGRRLRDLIRNVGIKLQFGTDQTALDN